MRETDSDGIRGTMNRSVGGRRRPIGMLSLLTDLGGTREYLGCESTAGVRNKRILLVVGD